MNYKQIDKIIEESVDKLTKEYSRIYHSGNILVIEGITFCIDNRFTSKPQIISMIADDTKFPINNKLYENIINYLRTYDIALKISIARMLTELGHTVKLCKDYILCDSTYLIYDENENTLEDASLEALISHPHHYRFHLSDPEVFNQISNYIKQTNKTP